MCYFSFLWWRAPVGIPVITYLYTKNFYVKKFLVYKYFNERLPTVNVSILDPIPNTIITVHKIEQF